MFDAVRKGDSPYDEQQRQAWLAAPPAGPEWEERLSAQDIVVAETDGRAVGFMSLGEEGYIDLVFIRPEARNNGLFRKMFERVEHKAMARGDRRLWVHASLAARPVFEAVGFTVERSEWVKLGTEQLQRFEMEKTLPGFTQR
jgi:putative acetyltransferase